MKVAFYDTKPYDRTSFEPLGEANQIRFKFFEDKLTEDTAPLARGCDAVCVFVNDNVNAAVIDLLCDMGIRVLLLRCAGFNNVDLRHASGKLTVLRVPAYSPYAIAEHAMALLLTSIRRIHKAYIRTRDFNFSLTNMVGFDLHGKTVGVVGTGKIGRCFINICRGFGMKVLCYDPFPADDSSLSYVPLDRLFRESDIISFHCPLTPETHHVVNAESLATMKKGVVLINTSRGALIDSEALLAGIKSRKVGAACLDVYEEESDIFFEDNSGHILEDDTLARLISMPNVIVTTHQAFLTEEALANIADTTVRNLLDFAEGKPGANEVCYRCAK